MSKQWTIENDTGADLTVRAPNGFAVELDASSADPRERFAYFAIHQQASDMEQLRADLAAVVVKRDEWAGGAARLSSQLGNLLAVIHRDGGHYESEHGTEKACADAMQRICDTRAGLGAADELAMLVRRLARALQKAAPDNDLPKTAMDYLSIAGLAGSPMRMDE